MEQVDQFFKKNTKPAENGRKASLLRNWPSESKKCWGLKTSGVSHSFLSKSTDESMALIGVPWEKNQNKNKRRDQSVVDSCLEASCAFAVSHSSLCESSYSRLPLVWSVLPVLCLCWPFLGSPQEQYFPSFETREWRHQCKACWVCRSCWADDTVRSLCLSLPGLSLSRITNRTQALDKNHHTPVLTGIDEVLTLYLWVV